MVSANSEEGVSVSRVTQVETGSCNACGYPGEPAAYTIHVRSMGVRLCKKHMEELLDKIEWTLGEGWYHRGI